MEYSNLYFTENADVVPPEIYEPIVWNNSEQRHGPRSKPFFDGFDSSSVIEKNPNLGEYVKEEIDEEEPNIN